MIDELERIMIELGLSNEPLSVRMTGCPNGCARPYNPDIGLVGRSGDKFTLFVGGNTRGDRLNFVLQDLLPQAQTVSSTAALLFDRFKSGRQGSEGFGDWCTRQGVESLCGQLGIALPKPV